MIDFHTHILPNIDDGAESIEESKRMIEKLQSQGVSEILFTPHFSSKSRALNDFLEERDEKYSMLSASFPEMNFYKGAEVAFNRIKKCDLDYSTLTINNTSYVLLELPKMSAWHKDIANRIDSICSIYLFKPIIAHVELYKEIQQDISILDDFIKMGYLLQMDLDSLNIKSVRKFALKLLEHNYIHIIGSDCHNITSRPPRYDVGIQTIKEKFGQEKVDYLQNNMKNMLLGKEVQTKKPKKLRKIFGLYF